MGAWIPVRISLVATLPWRISSGSIRVMILGHCYFQEDAAAAKLDKEKLNERRACATEWAGFRRAFFSRWKLADVPLGLASAIESAGGGEFLQVRQCR